MLMMLLMFGTFATGRKKMWIFPFVLLVLAFAEFGGVSVDCDEVVYFIYFTYVGYGGHIGHGYFGYVDDA
jgi:hypothetical protein